MVKQSQIRNFSIIAHIDHGKSTLADRLMEYTHAISKRESQEQYLDKMSIERERGITIKAQTVRLNYKSPKDGQEYIINIIDTPGHVDFNYEVSRALAACEGALLVVDASQGIQAQTLANVYLAIENNLEILPVLNKIDLPAADPDRVKKEIEDVIGLDTSRAIPCSAKTGIGIADILQNIVEVVPPPQGDPDAPLQALIFDSWFDPYQGVVVLFRVMQGTIHSKSKILLMIKDKTFELDSLGVFTPHDLKMQSLSVGEVGYLTAAIKDVDDVKIGDTITLKERPAAVALKGFKEVRPVVFSGIYPTDTAQYEQLQYSLQKLRLNDSSFSYEPETSLALGFGFRCGFLGLLHMEVIRERLEREYNLALISTSPTVVYHVYKTDGSMEEIDNPAKMPPIGEIEHIEEPYVDLTIHVPNTYLGAVIQLCENRRATQKKMEYYGHEQVMLVYSIPFCEIIFDFFDKLKSITKGYASLDYELTHPQVGELIKLNIMINAEVVDALSIIIHKEKAFYRGRELVSKLKEIIPRQQFEVAIQAAIGTKIVARETVKPLRKNVIAKCYGGDITRKRKLLEKQKEGKKRMKQVGSVELPQEAFLAALKID